MFQFLAKLINRISLLPFSIDLKHPFGEMGCVIKDDENHRGTTRKVSRQSELLRSVLVHVASAFVCALVCCFSYWFPWFYCFINHFVWIYLPTVWPVVFGPKCMFVVANAILVVVVGDWRKTCAKSKSPYEDMYEEYVRRSRGPRRVLIYKKVKRKISANVIEIKKVEVAKETADEKNEVIAEEDNIETGLDNSDKNNEMVDEASTYKSEEKQQEMKDELQADKNSAEASNDHVDAVAHDHDHDEEEETTSLANDGQNKEITKEEEITRSCDDELNKRVEDFIARVNKRRWAEANSWLICSA
ncbi:unnamed protein product [Rhodiola kirilowii]